MISLITISPLAHCASNATAAHSANKLLIAAATILLDDARRPRKNAAKVQSFEIVEFYYLLLIENMKIDIDFQFRKEFF
jgi:hypothetical protein